MNACVLRIKCTSCTIVCLWICVVHALKVEIGELKGRLTEVISNCDAICKRISSEGPESLRLSIEPFVVATTDSGSSCNSSSQQVDLNTNPHPQEPKLG